MSRSPARRLDDVEAAVRAVDEHLRRGPIEDPLVLDAVRARLIEIGEAVEDLPPGLVSNEPGIPWRAVARMRDTLTHTYFETDHTIVAGTVENDLPKLLAAVGRLRRHL